jgi:hypothetical protein
MVGVIHFGLVLILFLVEQGIISRENNNLLMGFTPSLDQTATLVSAVFFTGLTFLTYLVTLDKSATTMANINFSLPTPTLKLLTAAVPVMSYGILLFIILTLLLSDLDRFILSSGYLSNKDPEYMGFESGVGKFVFTLFKLLWLPVPILLVVCLRKKYIFGILTALVSLCFYYFYFLSAASRIAPLLLVLTAGTIAVMFHGRYKIWVAMLLFIGLLSYQSVLVSRNQYHHGFATLEAKFNTMEVSGSAISGMVSNIFMGGSVFAEGYIMRAEYNSIYKILSFSPFPSFIDGFNQIRENEEIRITEFAPLNAYAEVYGFGWFYLLAFIIFYAAFTRQMQSQIARGGFAATLLLVLFVYLQFRLQQYSLRTSLRLMYLLYVLLLIFPILQKKLKE